VGRSRKKITEKENQVRFDLNTPEEVARYRLFRSLLVQYGETLRDRFLPCIEATITELSKRRLPLNTPLRLSKKKSAVIVKEK